MSDKSNVSEEFCRIRLFIDVSVYLTPFHEFRDVVDVLWGIRATDQEFSEVLRDFFVYVLR